VLTCMCRARLAKIKQDQAKSISKRGHGLGRKFPLPFALLDFERAMLILYVNKVTNEHKPSMLIFLVP